MKKLLPLFLICARVQAVHAQNMVTARLDSAQVRVTVAQEGLSLVSDERKVQLEKGSNLIRFPGVATRLEPHTVQPLITGPATVEILQQRFRHDLRNSKSVLSRYVGQNVTLMRANAPPITGTLIAADEIILLETQEGVLVNPEGTFSVPKIADRVVGIQNLSTASDAVMSTPTLEWLVNATTAGPYTVEARYGTSGLNWRATYRASLNTAGDRLTLKGWLEVSNDSGADYRRALVILPRAQVIPPGGGVGQSEQATLSNPVDLLRHESVQLSYVSVTELPVTEEMVFFAAEAQPDFTKPYQAAPRIMLRLRNAGDIGLGVPLPAGPLLLWGVAADRSLRQVAQQNLPHTEPNQRLWIARGLAPLIAASRSQTAARQLNPMTNENTIQITLTNERRETVSVSVVERLPVSAKLRESSTPAIPLEPNLVEFKVSVPPNGTAVVKYVLEVKKEGG